MRIWLHMVHLQIERKCLKLNLDKAMMEICNLLVNTFVTRKD